jgi:hypothetical protein
MAMKNTIQDIKLACNARYIWLFDGTSDFAGLDHTKFITLAVSGIFLSGGRAK